MRAKRWIALLLCAAMMLTLFAGCGKKEPDFSVDIDSSEKKPDESKPGDTTTPDKTSQGDKSYAEFVYIPTYSELKLPEKTRVNKIVSAGDMFYLLCSEVTGQSIGYYGDFTIDDDDDADDADSDEPMDSYYYDVFGPAIYTMKQDFTGLKKLEGFVPGQIPEGREGNVNINQIVACDDGTIWINESIYSYSYDEDGMYNGDGGQRYNIRHLDKDGTELACICANDLFPDEEWLYISAIAITKDGNCVVTDSSENTIKVVDEAGNVLSTMVTVYYIDNYINTEDEIYAVYWGENGNSISKLDLERGELGEAINLPQNVWNTIPGSDLYTCYFSNETALYGFDIKTGQSTMLINWLSSDIDGNDMYNLWVDKEGHVFSLLSDWSGENLVYTVARFEKADPETLPEKITMTLGCNYIDYNVRSKVLEFNRANDKYRIEIIDYSQYNTGDDYSAGITKLNTEIISGKSPDLLVTGSLPVETYAAKGLFEDLYPFIDSDPELSRDKLMESALKAYEYDGKLYEAFSSFTLSTVLGPSNVVGAAPGWTVDQLMELKNRLPAGMNIFCNMAQEDMLYTILRMNLDSYIDWSTGECKFDTGEFATLLEFAKSFPQDFDWKNDYVDENLAIMKGQCLLTSVYIYNFNVLQRYKLMYNGDVTCIGFPSENGCGTITDTDFTIAMSSTCKEKDAAWQFIRGFFDEEYQKNYVWWGFPTNKAAFESMAQNAMEQTYHVDENGETVPDVLDQWWIDEDTTLYTYAATEEEVEQIRQLIYAVGEAGSRNSYNEDIYNMIIEETQFYFAGQKSAADVANVIQSRVKIYVSQHM